MATRSIDVSSSSSQQHYTLTLNKNGTSWNLVLSHNESPSAGTSSGAYGTATGNISGVASGSYSKYFDFRNYGTVVLASGTCSRYGTVTVTFNSDTPFVASGKSVSVSESQETYSHTVSFDANGGYGAPSSYSVTSSSASTFSTTLPYQTPYKVGYNFVGWSLSRTGSASYYPNVSYTFSSTNITLYAIYSANYTLNVVAEGEGTGSVYINGTPANANMTFASGTSIMVRVVPSSSTSYLQKVEKLENGATTDVTTKHTISTYEFSFTIKSDVTLTAYFELRDTYTLSVDSTYTINGTGTYKYLDRPTLLANLGGVSFSGWYEDDVLLSNQNPYTFDMPDRDLELTILTGEQIFDNLKVRQFALQNGAGEVYKLTSKNSKIFLNNPQNLGFSKSIVTNRIGKAELVQNETYNMPQPSGELIFHKNTISGKYDDYYEFARFISKKPITLWYKIPTDSVINEYHIPVEVMSMDKQEVNEQKVLVVPIQFYGTNFWQHTESALQSSTNEIEVYNDSDFEVGIKITCRRTNSGTFTHPKIQFIQNGVEYGAIAFANGTFSEIELDTRDKTEEITTYDSSHTPSNSLFYLDFSYADGVKQFPFPKLKQGYTTIKFTFDNDSDTSKVYLIEYDKEYLSV